MHSTQDLRLQRIVKAVRETSKALKKALPERDPVGDLGGERNGTRAGNVLSPHLAAVAAGLDEAQLQPAGRVRKRTNIVVARLSPPCTRAKLRHYAGAPTLRASSKGAMPAHSASVRSLP